MCMKDCYVNNKKEFIKFYDIYRISKDKDKQFLIDFLDSIELNKNYFKTGLKQNHKKTSKLSDTYTIKSLNNNLNKISNLNKDYIISDILKECHKKIHLYSYFFDVILHKTITHTNYIDCYSLIIKELIDKDTINILLKNIDLIKKEINIHHNIKTNINTSYDSLCDINLYTEKIYGLNLLLVKLEKLGVLNDYIHKNLDDLFFILENTKDDNIIFRVLSCLEQMNNEINDLLNEKSQNKLASLKKSLKPKNKFKIMDILEKYN